MTTATRSRSATLPLLATAVTMILWASAFIVIRSVGDHYSPGPLALGRLAAGSVALSLVAALRPRRIPRGRPLLLVIGYGVLWFGIYAVALNAAEHHLDAGTTALVVNVGPILIAVLAGVYLKEGFPRGLVTGLVIAFSGVVTIAIATSTGRHDAAGVLLALAAAALYAVGVLLQKQALRDVDPFTATWLGCLAGTVACLPFAPGLLTELRDAPGSATLSVVYLGVFPTAIAFATWAYALKRMSAGGLSSSSYVVPGIAVVLSWLLLGEVPAPLAFAGGALCLLGVAVTRLPPSALLHILGNKSGPGDRM
ncbi:EamA family transporter [Actinoplanes sp. ATCC 53533]|uniref:DMT family transporter n=1 Tax=Actinoplanes sp. ATCC 53533 TaxID=1288362 RepID=UPI000F78F9D1|nr:DMT family transporter [Actinoplanes sp. ATCC 53533]RSM58117.1 EamA family transporter [Actinoplanes sp. ATCC 53533]